jgi:MFS family permease
LRVPAGRASLLFPALNLAVIAGSLTGPRLLKVLGARRTLLAGFAGIAGGIISLLALPSEGLPVAQLLAAFAVVGAGLGVASVASTQTGTNAADPEYRGVVSGVLNSAAQVGTAVGVALLLPLAASWLGHDGGLPHQFIGAGRSLAGAFASFLVPRDPAEEQGVPDIRLGRTQLHRRELLRDPGLSRVLLTQLHPA